MAEKGSDRTFFIKFRKGFVMTSFTKTARAIGNPVRSVAV